MGGGQNYYNDHTAQSPWRCTQPHHGSRRLLLFLLECVDGLLDQCLLVRGRVDRPRVQPGGRHGSSTAPIWGRGGAPGEWCREDAWREAVSGRGGYCCWLDRTLCVRVRACVRACVRVCTVQTLHMYMCMHPLTHTRTHTHTHAHTHILAHACMYMYNNMHAYIHADMTFTVIMHAHRHILIH